MRDLERDLARLTDDERHMVELIRQAPTEERAAAFLEMQHRLIVRMVTAADAVRVGPMAPGHRMARKWTFTAKRWEPISFLFRIGDEVVVSSVQATREDSAEADEEWILLSAGNSRTLFVYICPECAQSKKSLQDGFNIFVDALPEAMQTERG